MKKIRFLFAALLLIGSLSLLSAAGSDVVVLMDTSGTILPYFEDINSRILTEIARKFVRPGDTFHLVSFNARVNLEIAQSVRTEADISRIVSRFMLLYPLGQNSDFLSGIQYTHQYVSSLNQGTRKIIIIISDGIFNPPASSTYASLDTEQVKTELGTMAARIRADGWSVYYIKIPFPDNAEIRNLDGQLVSTSNSSTQQPGVTNAAKTTGVAATGVAASGEEAVTETPPKQYQDVSEEFTSALDIQTTELPAGDIPLTFVDSLFAMPEVTFPGYLGREGRFLTIPLRIKNSSDKKQTLELTGVIWNGENILRNKAFLNLNASRSGTMRAQVRIPEAVQTGPQSLPITLEFSQNMRVTPQTGTLSFKLVSFTIMSLLLSLGPVLSVLLLVLIALVLIILLVRFLHLSTSQGAAKVLRNVPNSKDTEESRQVRSTQDEKLSAQAAILSASSAATEKVDYRSLLGREHGQKQQLSYSNAENSKAATGATLAAGEQTKIDYNAALANAVPQKTDYRTVMAAAESGKNRDLSSLGAFEQAREQEKNERLAMLAAAAHKPDRHGSFTAAKSGQPVQVTANRNIMLELIVTNQNPHIGKRNIHVMKPGSRLSLGGQLSSFLVFLVRFPAKIAEVRFDGTTCNLAILKPRYFPNAESNVIENCVGKEITLLSDHDYEVKFTLREYEDPVLKLNRLLTSITFDE